MWNVVSAPVLAAAVAAAISLLSLIISKENKTSEFRQAWIDAVRADVGEAIAAASVLTFVLDGGPANQSTAEFREAWVSASASLARIEMRLNTDEEDHRTLIATIGRVHQLLMDLVDGKYDSPAARDLRHEAVTNCNAILRREWRRVKSGEPVFQFTRWGIAVVFFLATAYLIVHL